MGLLDSARIVYVAAEKHTLAPLADHFWHSDRGILVFRWHIFLHGLSFLLHGTTAFSAILMSAWSLLYIFCSDFRLPVGLSSLQLLLGRVLSWRLWRLRCLVSCLLSSRWSLAEPARSWRLSFPSSFRPGTTSSQSVQYVAGKITRFQLMSLSQIQIAI